MRRPLFIALLLLFSLRPFAYSLSDLERQALTTLSHSSLEKDYLLDQKMRNLKSLQANTQDKESAFKLIRETIGSLAVSPKPEDRKRGINLNLEFLSQFYQQRLYGETDILSFLKKESHVRHQYTGQETKDFIKNARTLERNDSAKEYAETLCGPNPAPGCKESVKKAIEIMAPVTLRSNANLAMMDSWIEVALDPMYAQAASSLAIKVIEKSRLPDDANSFGNLFDDATESFLNSGSPSLANAQTRALKLLGIFATRGVDILFLFYYDWKFKDTAFMRPFHFSLFASLALIGSAINYLDLKTMESGHTYSYPTNIINHLSYAKPYHFWMAAFLAYRLNHEFNFSAMNSVDAVLRTSAAYELQANTRTKHQGQIYLADSNTVDPNNFYVIEVQKNMVFNVVGALWGIGQGCNQPSSLDADFYFHQIRQPVDKIENLSDIYSLNIFYRIGAWLQGYKTMVLDFNNEVHLFSLSTLARTSANSICKDH